jgi:predicted ATPase
MLERRLNDLWGNLQGKKSHMPQFLAGVRLMGIRGIDDLRVVFDYPVSVIAGGNASGKSTVLFAAACAYKVPGAGVKDFVPSTLFPYYRPKVGEREDDRQEITIEFDYLTPDGRLSMLWRRGKGWNRSFLGRKGASQPERQIYLRTLSNLSNPAEVRGVLSMSHSSAAPMETRLTASQIEFAQQMLPFKYAEVVNLSSGSKNLLFAAQEGGAAYSELHMAAGERAILRLSQEIAQLNGALILIDEVEAGLHPWVQQLLMLQLQQLALRNSLQVIVTSHSPVVLDSVPANGRIFLDRDEIGKVTVRPAYRDVVQNALYGRSGNALNILCEDNAAEGILDGVFDVLCPRQGIGRDSVHIGRDTGASEFPVHAIAFRKFGQIRNFVFVLDGDKRGSDILDKIQDSARTEVPVLFLPGRDAPEVWVWETLRTLSRNNEKAAATELGINQGELLRLIDQANAVYDSASDRPSEIAKSKLRSLAEDLHRDTPDICRIVAKLEANRRDSDIQPLGEGLESALLDWRGR